MQPEDASHAGAPDAVIDVRGLSKTFDAVRAVDAVSFTVKAGSTFGLLGANGAGKTTTLALLLGLVTPSAGSIRLFGLDLARRRYEILPRLNFSSPYVDLPLRLTVRENLLFYGRLYGVRRLADRIAVLAGDLGLEEFLDRGYGSLSAGQRTRVALAKALVNSPALLLLDEPTASLDPDVSDRIRAYLATYQRATGATVVLASHNMTEVERICGEVALMRAGRIVATGSPAALIARFGRTTMEEVFLDVARDGARTPQAAVR
ncbi:MAG: ABC transporter ATP-binding protein [Gammaproteobacteria bacterium]